MRKKIIKNQCIIEGDAKRALDCDIKGSISTKPYDGGTDPYDDTVPHKPDNTLKVAIFIICAVLTVIAGYVVVRNIINSL